MPPPHIDIDAEIGERILRWRVDRAGRVYTDERNGETKLLPDLAALGLLVRDKMQSLGFTLTITENRPDREGTFTARFTRADSVFETTDANANLAVCLAALKTIDIMASS